MGLPIKKILKYNFNEIIKDREITIFVYISGIEEFELRKSQSPN